jgi:hypothetical protein
MGFHKYFMSPSSLSHLSGYRLHNWTPVSSRSKNFSYCQHVSTNSRAHKLIQLVTGTYTSTLLKRTVAHILCQDWRQTVAVTTGAACGGRPPQASECKEW